MSGVRLSRHAEARVRQRGLKSETVEILFSYGCRKRRHGADVYFMDKKARLTVIDALGAKQFAQIERSLNAYLVVASDGTVITCAKRMTRICN